MIYTTDVGAMRMPVKTFTKTRQSPSKMGYDWSKALLKHNKKVIYRPNVQNKVENSAATYRYLSRDANQNAN